MRKFLLQTAVIGLSATVLAACGGDETQNEGSGNEGGE